jgi:histidinol phosphatase-like PHP family hydrolase
LPETTLSNRQIAELLSSRSHTVDGHARKAFRRAARRAFTWTEEYADLAAAGRDPTELAGIGPYLKREIAKWIDDGVRPDEPPPLRSDFLTMADARRILASSDVKIHGDLQMHTTWSDGGSTVEAMARAADALGYSYIAITDHSQKLLPIVRGLDEERLVRQAVEIESVNASVGVRILRSIEMNLSPSGEGDLAPSALGKLDLVLGSFHSQLRKKEDQTERYLAAISNPTINVLAHPRGRIYDYRAGLVAEWPRVFDAAAAADVALEIDSYPDRQDLNVELLKMAREAGVRISIGTDAHDDWQLPWIALGVAAAVEAGIKRDRILNTMSVDELLAWSRSRRLAA